jgi:son of sevenless
LIHFDCLLDYYDADSFVGFEYLKLDETDIELDETKNIKCASVDKIIEYLTNRKDSDNDSLYTFMLCYRSFISPYELIKKLKLRYLTPYPQYMKSSNDQSEWIQSELIPIRLKISQILKLWLEHHFYDFDPELTELIVDFIKLMKNTNGKNLASSIETTLLKKQSKSKSTIQTKRIGYVENIPKKWESMFDWDPKEIARQITFREYLIFRKIGPGECVNKAWSSKDKATKAPNILELINWFNLFSGYLATTILTSPNVKDRAKTLSFCINLANEFKALNNINGIYEVISSLNLASVHRLKLTWATIPQKDKALADELAQYVSNDSNFKYIREQVAIAIPPLIPYLGLFLTDLTFIDEGNQDFVNNKINFVKVQRVSTIIRNIKTYQQTPYDIHLIEPLQNYFDEIDFRLTEDDMYDLSILREPRKK